MVLRFDYNLLGLGEVEGGSRVIKYGEFVRNWSVSSDGNTRYQFTPDGADEPVCSAVFVGHFVGMITEYFRDNGVIQN